MEQKVCVWVWVRVRVCACACVRAGKRARGRVRVCAQCVCIYVSVRTRGRDRFPLDSVAIWNYRNNQWAANPHSIHATVPRDGPVEDDGGDLSRGGEAHAPRVELEAPGHGCVAAVAAVAAATGCLLPLPDLRHMPTPARAIFGVRMRSHANGCHGVSKLFSASCHDPNRVFCPALLSSLAHAVCT